MLKLYNTLIKAMQELADRRPLTDIERSVFQDWIYRRNRLELKKEG